MAGHSKWANIKHKKGRADAKKGKVFSRIAKEIISAVKQGGADPKSNSKLRLVQKTSNGISRKLRTVINQILASLPTNFMDMGEWESLSMR